ncbi:ATP-binding protein [Longimicrobium terrae]|uniref:ATP-binding protein n=1 Tax=Longimicrobium terrae TaxID=1639882 RepID=UPI00161283BA
MRDYAIFLMDADGVITFWGEGARLIKWWTREETHGSHLRLLYPDYGSQDGTAESHLKIAAETGEYTGEGERVRRDGSTFWGGITLTALRDGGGRLLGFAKVTRDLTARRAADAMLKAARDAAEEARRQAEEANRAKSLFLATMSHEIRTPINAVMGYADLLDMGLSGPLNDEQRDRLARIRSSNLHLLGIVDEVLDFSRLDAGRVTLSRRAGRLAPPIDAALDMVRMQAQAKGVLINDSVSGFASDLPYHGDEDRVRQILVVLLSNAVKFTPAGGRITVSAGTSVKPDPGAMLPGEGPWVYVRVEDTGQGIPPARLGAIFEPFEQADMALTRQHGGTGLGLTIAKRLARLMDGDLTVRSQPGAGSSFFVWLPAAPEDAVPSGLSGGGTVDSDGPALLRKVRDAIIVELERILYGYVARLRSDPATPSAHTLGAVELEDHLATFLSDLADTFRGLELEQAGESRHVRDGSAIQRTVAERHGTQRRRLGWSEDELRREFVILTEEVLAAVHRGVRDEKPELLDEAGAAVADFLDAARTVSLESWKQSG